MNKLIEELAIASGIYDSLCDPYDALQNGDHYSSIKVDLEKFAVLVAAREREACAKVCDVLAVHPEYASDITKVAAQAIRARGEQ